MVAGKRSERFLESYRKQVLKILYSMIITILTYMYSCNAFHMNPPTFPFSPVRAMPINTQESHDAKSDV